MGLFGYNQKNYEKNTVIFKDRLTEMLFESDTKLGNGKLLNSIIYALDKKLPQNADWKALEKIDKRISELIDKLQQDNQLRQPMMFSAHANMLLTAVKQSRNYGRVAFTPDQERAEEIVHECRAKIFETLNARDEIESKMKEIEEKAANLEAGTSRYMMLEQQYGDLESELQQTERQYKIYQQRHNANVKIIQTKKTGDTYDSLPEKIASTREFEQLVEQINKKAAEEADYTADIGDAADELAETLDSQLGSVRTQSGLSGKLAAKQQAAMASGIDSADVPYTEERSTTSSLSRKLGK